MTSTMLARVILSTQPSSMRVKVRIGKISISGRSQGAFSPKTVAPGTTPNQTARIRIKKIPVANSGITENVMPPMESTRSRRLPSLSPASRPRNSASGITITKAIPARTNEFLRRTKMLLETGRPVRNDTPGSPRINPFFNGIYFTGPPELSFQPDPIMKVQTLRPAPFSHMTAWFSLSSPQKVDTPFSSVTQRSLFFSRVTLPSGCLTMAIRLSPASFQRIS